MKQYSPVNILTDNNSTQQRQQNSPVKLLLTGNNSKQQTQNSPIKISNKNSKQQTQNNEQLLVESINENSSIKTQEPFNLHSDKIWQEVERRTKNTGVVKSFTRMLPKIQKRRKKMTPFMKKVWKKYEKTTCNESKISNSEFKISHVRSFKRK